MSLRQKQSRFAIEAAKLILVAESMGFEVTYGDAYRDERCNYGSPTSAHKKRLAIDFNLFRDGEYLTDTASHSPLGSYWKTIGGIWGGDFSTPDGNHYEWPD